MNNSNELARNAFKPIIENPIILDFSGCQLTCTPKTEPIDCREKPW